MKAEQLYRLFQMGSRKPEPVFIDPDDPKGIKAIQAILKKQDEQQEKANINYSLSHRSGDE